MKNIISFVIVWFGLALWLTGDGSLWAQTSSAESPIITVDTRDGSPNSDESGIITVDTRDSVWEPQIGTQPQSQTVTMGGSLNLYVTVVGLEPFSFQWRKEGTNLLDGGRITGVANNVLNLSSVQAADAGGYSVVINNAFGSITSQVATLTAMLPPIFSLQPTNQSGLVGGSVSFHALASGATSVTYQWRRDGANLANSARIDGVTTVTLMITNLQTTDAGIYTVVAANAAGVVTSDPATLIVSTFRMLVNGQSATGPVRVPVPAVVEFQPPGQDWLVFYTLDGSVPDESKTLYQGPFNLDTAATVYPIAFSPDFAQSVLGLPVQISFFRTQTVTVMPVTGLKYGDSPVTLQAAGSSGLPVTWTLLSGPGQLLGNVLTVLGAGTLTLRASQSGNAEYSPAQADLTIPAGKAEQTITWAPLVNKTYLGEPPFTVTATASSGLAVVFELVSGPAQVSSNRVTLTGAGSVTLRALQAGDTNYLAATLERSFTVAKASQTITLGALADRVFTPVSFSVPAFASSSSLAVQFSILSGPATLASNSITLTGVGRVIVRAQQPGNENYLPAGVVDFGFNVTQATQTLTFDPVPAKMFGDPTLSLRVVSSAGLTNIQYSLISGPGTLAGGQLTLAGAGTIIVKAAQAGDERYAATQVELRIDVARAVQTITFPNLADQGYSTNPIPLLAAASSGLPISYTVVGGAALVSGTNSLVLTTNMGLVEVRADQPGNSNYLAAAAVTRTFTVSRGAQTIDFPPIADQVLGVMPLTLAATTSSGLPVTFELLIGPATLSGNKLTLLDAGEVTVIARQVGGRLYLPSSVEQTFTVRRMATLTLVVDAGGRVMRQPDKDQFAPGESVVLTATSDAGFEFTGWSGDASGQQNSLTLVMDANRRVEARFRDAQSPVVTLLSPVAGTTDHEVTELAGTATDNAEVVSLTWERDGQPQGALSLTNSHFRVAGLRLNRGANLFRVIAKDAATNQAVASVLVTWEPSRTLAVIDPPEQQEGNKIAVPLVLTSQGDIGGMSFVLHYDTNYLKEPQLTWSSLVGGSLNQVNYDVSGEVGASFALPATAVPAGTNLIANIIFRVRSVPFNLNTKLTVELLEVSQSSGQPIEFGSDAHSGIARILQRRMNGDNNANDHLDIGDATLIQRMVTKLDLTRTWDITLNDLDLNGLLDSGDVISVLRVVTGMNPQPGKQSLGDEIAGAYSMRAVLAPHPDPLPADGARGLTKAAKAKLTLSHRDELPSQGVSPLPQGEGQGEGDANLRLTITLSAQSPQITEQVLLLLPSSPAQPGSLVTAQVVLTNLQTHISGATFALDYPTNALRLLNAQAHRTGALVPGTAIAVWNVAPAQNNYATQTGRISLAASSASPWTGTNGILAELTFQVQAGANSQTNWPLKLSAMEITPDGYDNRLLPDVTVNFSSGQTVQPPKWSTITRNSSLGTLNFSLTGDLGAKYQIEASTNLTSWTLLQLLTNQTGTMQFSDSTTNLQKRFFRAKPAN